MVQWYSPDCINVHPVYSTPQSASEPWRFCPLLSRFKYIDRRTCWSMSWAGRCPLKITPSCVKIQFSRFFCTADGRKSLYFTIGHPFLPQNCPLHGDWGYRPHLYVVPWPHPSPHPNGISIGSTVFAGLLIVTDRPTDRPRYSCVTVERIYVVVHCRLIGLILVVVEQQVSQQANIGINAW